MTSDSLPSETPATHINSATPQPATPPPLTPKDSLSVEVEEFLGDCRQFIKLEWTIDAGSKVRVAHLLSIVDELRSRLAEVEKENEQLKSNEAAFMISKCKEVTWGCGHTNRGSCSRCLGSVTNERNMLKSKIDAVLAALADGKEKVHNSDCALTLNFRHGCTCDGKEGGK